MSQAETPVATPGQRRDETPDPTRPQIAWDLHCMLNSARAAAASVPAAELSVAAALTCAADALGAHTRGFAPKVAAHDVVTAALAARCGELAGELQQRGGRGVATQAQRLDGLVKSGMLADRLADAWDSSSHPGPLAVSLDELRAAGADSERVAWALIGFEAQRHINLIWHVANKLTRHFPDRTAADLFGWGWQGLRVALRGYDPARGFKFSTYACRRISGAIQDGVRAENPIPKRLTTFVRKVAKAEERLAAELGRPATVEEVARLLVADEAHPGRAANGDLSRLPELVDMSAKLDQKLAELSLMPRLTSAASIEELTAMAGERGGELPVLIDTTDPGQLALEAERRDAIEAALGGLPDCDAEAARLLLYEGLSVAEARQRTGATAQQLRRRCARAREHLAVALVDWQ